MAQLVIHLTLVLATVPRALAGRGWYIDANTAARRGAPLQIGGTVNPLDPALLDWLTSDDATASPSKLAPLPATVSAAPRLARVPYLGLGLGNASASLQAALKVLGGDSGSSNSRGEPGAVAANSSVTAMARARAHIEAAVAQQYDPGTLARLSSTAAKLKRAGLTVVAALAAVPDEFVDVDGALRDDASSSPSASSLAVPAAPVVAVTGQTAGVLPSPAGTATASAAAATATTNGQTVAAVESVPFVATAAATTNMGASATDTTLAAYALWLAASVHYLLQHGILIDMLEVHSQPDRSHLAYISPLRYNDLVVLVRRLLAAYGSAAAEIRLAGPSIDILPPPPGSEPYHRHHLDGGGAHQTSDLGTSEGGSGGSRGGSSRNRVRVDDVIRSAPAEYLEALCHTSTFGGDLGEELEGIVPPPLDLESGGRGVPGGTPETILSGLDALSIVLVHVTDEAGLRHGKGGDDDDEDGAAAAGKGEGAINKGIMSEGTDLEADDDDNDDRDNSNGDDDDDHDDDNNGNTNGVVGVQVETLPAGSWLNASNRTWFATAAAGRNATNEAVAREMLVDGANSRRRSTIGLRATKTLLGGSRQDIKGGGRRALLRHAEGDGSITAGEPDITEPFADGSSAGSLATGTVWSREVNGSSITTILAGGATTSADTDGTRTLTKRRSGKQGATRTAGGATTGGTTTSSSLPRAVRGIYAALRTHAQLAMIFAAQSASSSSPAQEVVEPEIVPAAATGGGLPVDFSAGPVAADATSFVSTGSSSSSSSSSLISSNPSATGPESSASSGSTAPATSTGSANGGQNRFGAALVRGGEGEGDVAAAEPFPVLLEIDDTGPVAAAADMMPSSSFASILPAAPADAGTGSAASTDTLASDSQQPKPVSPDRASSAATVAAATLEAVASLNKPLIVTMTGGSQFLLPPPRSSLSRPSVTSRAVSGVSSPPSSSSSSSSSSAAAAAAVAAAASASSSSSTDAMHSASAVITALGGGVSGLIFAHFPDAATSSAALSRPPPFDVSTPTASSTSTAAAGGVAPTALWALEAIHQLLAMDNPGASADPNSFGVLATSVGSSSDEEQGGNEEDGETKVPGGRSADRKATVPGSGSNAHAGDGGGGGPAAAMLEAGARESGDGAGTSWEGELGDFLDAEALQAERVQLAALRGPNGNIVASLSNPTDETLTRFLELSYPPTSGDGGSTSSSLSAPWVALTAASSFALRSSADDEHSGAAGVRNGEAAAATNTTAKLSASATGLRAIPERIAWGGGRVLCSHGIVEDNHGTGGGSGSAPSSSSSSGLSEYARAIAAEDVVLDLGNGTGIHRLARLTREGPRRFVALVPPKSELFLRFTEQRPNPHIDDASAGAGTSTSISTVAVPDAASVSRTATTEAPTPVLLSPQSAPPRVRTVCASDCDEGVQRDDQGRCIISHSGGGGTSMGAMMPGLLPRDARALAEASLGGGRWTFAWGAWGLLGLPLAMAVFLTLSPSKSLLVSSSGGATKSSAERQEMSKEQEKKDEDPPPGAGPENHVAADSRTTTTTKSSTSSARTSFDGVLLLVALAALLCAVHDFGRTPSGARARSSTRAASATGNVARWDLEGRLAPWAGKAAPTFFLAAAGYEAAGWALGERSLLPRLSGGAHGGRGSTFLSSRSWEYVLLLAVIAAATLPVQAAIWCLDGVMASHLPRVQKPATGATTAAASATSSSSAGTSAALFARHALRWKALLGYLFIRAFAEILVLPLYRAAKERGPGRRGAPLVLGVVSAAIFCEGFSASRQTAFGPVVRALLVDTRLVDFLLGAAVAGLAHAAAYWASTRSQETGSPAPTTTTTAAEHVALSPTPATDEATRGAGRQLIACMYGRMRRAWARGEGCGRVVDFFFAALLVVLLLFAFPADWHWPRHQQHQHGVTPSRLMVLVTTASILYFGHSSTRSSHGVDITGGARAGSSDSTATRLAAAAASITGVMPNDGSFRTTPATPPTASGFSANNIRVVTMALLLACMQVGPVVQLLAGHVARLRLGSISSSVGGGSGLLAWGAASPAASSAAIAVADGPTSLVAYLACLGPLALLAHLLLQRPAAAVVLSAARHAPAIASELSTQAELAEELFPTSWRCFVSVVSVGAAIAGAVVGAARWFRRMIACCLPSPNRLLALGMFAAVIGFHLNVSLRHWRWHPSHHQPQQQLQQPSPLQILHPGTGVIGAVFHYIALCIDAVYVVAALAPFPRLLGSTLRLLVIMVRRGSNETHAAANNNNNNKTDHFSSQPPCSAAAVGSAFARRDAASAFAHTLYFRICVVNNRGQEEKKQDPEQQQQKEVIETVTALVQVLRGLLRENKWRVEVLTSQRFGLLRGTAAGLNSTPATAEEQFVLGAAQQYVLGEHMIEEGGSSDKEAQLWQLGCAMSEAMADDFVVHLPVGARLSPQCVQAIWQAAAAQQRRSANAVAAAGARGVATDRRYLEAALMPVVPAAPVGGGAGTAATTSPFPSSPVSCLSGRVGGGGGGTLAQIIAGLAETSRVAGHYGVLGPAVAASSCQRGSQLVVAGEGGVVLQRQVALSVDGRVRAYWERLEGSAAACALKRQTRLDKRRRAAAAVAVPTASSTSEGLVLCATSSTLRCLLATLPPLKGPGGDLEAGSVGEGEQKSRALAGRFNGDTGVTTGVTGADNACDPKPLTPHLVAEALRLAVRLNFVAAATVSAPPRIHTLADWRGQRRGALCAWWNAGRRGGEGGRPLPSQQEGDEGGRLRGWRRGVAHRAMQDIAYALLITMPLLVAGISGLLGIGWAERHNGMVVRGAGAGGSRIWIWQTTPGSVVGGIACALHAWHFLWGFWHSFCGNNEQENCSGSGGGGSMSLVRNIQRLAFLGLALVVSIPAIAVMEAGVVVVAAAQGVASSKRRGGG